jgi:O-methyltransferase involved in polyketide biosynthesis
LDQPDVVEYRRKLFPEPEGDYTLLAGSVLDEDVLASVPDDRLTVVVAEGLVFYLEEGDVRDLIRRLCARFQSGGELLFDGLSPLIVELQKWSNWLSSGDWMRKQGTGFVSGISDPKALEELYPSLRLRSNVPWTAFEIKNPTVGHRLMRLVARLPVPQMDGFNLRYTF